MDVDKISDIVPKMKKQDITNMVPDVRDEVIEQSEILAVDWVHAFLEEIDRIEEFFVTKQDDLINEFIAFQDKFRIKTDFHE